MATLTHRIPYLGARVAYNQQLSIYIRIRTINNRCFMMKEKEQKQEEIAKVVCSRSRVTKITPDKLTELFGDYLEEAKAIAFNVDQILNSQDEGCRHIVFEKTLSPFQYWIENQISIEVEKIKDQGGKDGVRWIYNKDGLTLEERK